MWENYFYSLYLQVYLHIFIFIYLQVYFYICQLVFVNFFRYTLHFNLFATKYHTSSSVVLGVDIQSETKNERDWNFYFSDAGGVPWNFAAEGKSCVRFESDFRTLIS